jgi:non-specific serine/threonine protein kinase
LTPRRLAASPPSILDGISSLVDKNLLGPVRSRTGEGESRFGMLETVRDYAQERLAESGEEAAARRAQADWCVAYAEQAEPRLHCAAEAIWLDRLEAEHDNMRAALAWLEEVGDAAAGLRLMGALWPFWFYRSHRVEGSRWLERGLARGDDAPAGARAKALLGLGVLVHARGDGARAAALLEESMEFFRDLGEAGGAARALLMLAVLAETWGRHDRAAGLAEEASALLREAGDDAWLPIARYELGVVAYERGDLARATALLEEALVLYRENQDAWGAALSFHYLGLVACERGDHAEAATLFGESLALWREVGTEEGFADCLVGVAILAAACGRDERAIQLLGAAQAFAERLDYTFELPKRSRIERTAGGLRARLGDPAFAAAWAAGRALTPEGADGVAASVVAVLKEAPAVEPAPLRPSVPRAGLAHGTPFDLSPRELEVLRLLVAGRTDREIAAALFVGLRTAQWHVANILAKLGVKTRAAAVAVAIATGVVDADATPPA